MMENTDSQADQAWMLDWHRGATAVPLDGFQAWALAGLKACVRFDHALWGVGAGVDGDGRAFINSVHLHRISPQIMVDYEAVRDRDPLAQGTVGEPGRVVNLCMADARWQTADYKALQAHVHRYGLVNVLCLAMSDPQSGADQFVTLGRADPADRFSAAEARRFERLAPHAMQAYVTCRALSMAQGATRGGRDRRWVTAIIDRTGRVHDHDANFAAALQTEWAGWRDALLPAPLRELLAHQPARRWEFLGQQVKAEFTPVKDLYLMAVRQRGADDALSARERHVAQQYAGGATYREIATALQLSPATVRAHLRSVFSKLGVNNKAQVAHLLR